MGIPYIENCRKNILNEIVAALKIEAEADLDITSTGWKVYFGPDEAYYYQNIS